MFKQRLVQSESFSSTSIVRVNVLLFVQVHLSHPKKIMLALWFPFSTIPEGEIYGKKSTAQYNRAYYVSSLTSLKIGFHTLCLFERKKHSIHFVYVCCSVISMGHTFSMDAAE